MNTNNFIALLIIVVFCLSGCSSLSKTDVSSQVMNDPLQSFNRKVYTFNDTADKYIVKPIAKGYDNVIPEPAKNGVSNFLSNLGEPLNIFNNLLQGKVDRALASTYRLVINSTIGLFGLFDVADKLDVKQANEDFGQTLASWGVKPGPYLVLPILGPSNLRDGFGRLSDALTFSPFREISDSTSSQLGLYALYGIDTRVSLLPAEKVLESQLDPYGFLHSAYQQNRIKSIYDGSPPENSDASDYDDF